jgi:hypothetical protein
MSNKAARRAAKRETKRLVSTARPHDDVVFLRCENYMEYSETRRRMAFYDHAGREVEVIHAFPVRRGAIKAFRDEDRRLTFVEVRPLAGWRVYSLRWDEVQAFVAVGGYRTSNSTFMGWYYQFPKITDVPPRVYRFRREHAARLEMVYRGCWCGCDRRGEWRTKLVVDYQVVFAPRPLAYVRGAQLVEPSALARSPE